MKKKIILIVLSILIIIMMTIGITYAYFSSIEPINSNLNYTVSFEEGNYVLRAYTKENGFSSIVTDFNITSAEMFQTTSNKVVKSNTDTFIIELNNEEEDEKTCTFDYIWNWDSNSDSYTISQANVNEFTISGPFAETNVPNSTTSSLVLGTGSITALGNTMETIEVPITIKFYNLQEVDQANHAGKNYQGSIIIDNVSCLPPATDTITALASETGAGATDGHPGAMVSDEYGIRYVGENPSNFVWFNCSDLDNQNAETCERWRIIGVFDEKYDTNGDNIPDKTGQLVKIIRNDSLGSYIWDYKQSGVGSSTVDYGSNDWSDSQLMMMLNPPEFLNTGYVTENDASPVHSNTISGEYVVSNGINIYRNMGSYFDSSKTAYSPAKTTTLGFTSTTQPGATFTRMSTLSQSMIATVKWHLTGPNGGDFTSSSNGLASHFYAYERNDPDGTGYVYTGAGTRPKIWYGKVGLMYPSDYGFATNGTLSTSENGVVLTRNECLTHEINKWQINSTSTSYYNCAVTDWLLYAGATGGTSATKGSGSTQWTITPYSTAPCYVFRLSCNGYITVDGYTNSSLAGRPVLYLKAGVGITEGSGTYDSPYSLSQ